MSIKPILNVEQLDQIRDFIELGMVEDANNLITSSVQKESQEQIFNSVGTLTREVHDSLVNFAQDMRVQELAAVEMADARSRLNYVINMTEQAANRTIDNVDSVSKAICEISEGLDSISARWKTLMEQDISVNDFKSLVHDLDSFLNLTREKTSFGNETLNDIIMAQEFQDLSGQIIKRAIGLTTEVEDNLVELLKLFQVDLDGSVKNHTGSELEGPMPTDTDREDVMSSQDAVDDLLSSLGF